MDVLVGLDEAGVGAAFGSLWASAVHLVVGVAVDDSKRLTPRARNAMRAALLAPGVCHHGMGEVTAAEIDDLGMAEARRLVFDRALDSYAASGAPFPTNLVVDGTLFRAWRGVPYVCQPRADAEVPCVAAASVLAKTTRDAQVVAWCDEHPEAAHYALRSNKGYLAPAHIEGIRVHGRTAEHRHSFHIRALAAQGAE